MAEPVALSSAPGRRWRRRRVSRGWDTLHRLGPSLWPSLCRGPEGAGALVEPADYGRLPPPEPGASRAEISAFAMAYTAMGGNGAAPARTLGAGAVGQRSGGGFLARLLGGRGTPGVLDPAAEINMTLTVADP